MRKTLGTLILSTSAAMIITTSSLASVDVIYCQIAGHPKALVPPGAALPPATEFKLQTQTGFDRPFASPDGTKFFFTGLANLPTTEDECYIVWNNGVASTVAREGTAFGSPTGDNLGLGDQRMGINNAGQFAFGIDTAGATTGDEQIITWDGVQFLIAAREGLPVPGAPTELFGGALNSAHVLSNGTVALCAPNTNGTLPGTQDDFCLVGNTIVVQSGTPIAANLWTAFNESNWTVTPDGLHWMVVGDDDQPAATNRILVVDGVVKAREGVPLIGSSYVSNVSTTFGTNESVLCNDGSYLLRGHNVDGTDWVQRNGVVVAEKGGLVTTSGTATWSDAVFSDGFFLIAGNAVGDYIVGGLTNEPDTTKDAVLALNGTTIAVREGDMIDLNGNGIDDDDAFVGVFNNDDCFLTNSRKLVFFADARNGAGTSLGQMVLSKNLAPTGPSFAVTQLSWQAPDETFSLQYSNYGELHLTTIEPPTDQLLWVNASINGNWVIQNQPLMEIDGEGQSQRYSYDFAYSTPPGVQVPAVVLVSSITSAQLSSPPVGVPMTVPVQEHIFNAGNTLGEPMTSSVFFVPPPAVNVPNLPQPVTWEKVRRRGVPGVAERKNHCTPGGFARSLAWMNTFYNLKLPSDNNDVAEIFDKLRNIDHMETTKANGTYCWGRPASGILNCDDPNWGKMMKGLRKFINDKGLAGKLMATAKQFKSQSPSNPDFNPCDLFYSLQRGCDVISQWGYWPNGTTTDNTQRNGGHTITVVGAVKCGTEVTIFFRDDCSGMDRQNNQAQTGDTNADSGVKIGKFVAGGASGWTIRGHRWEGFIEICPKPKVMVDAIVKFALQEAAKVTEVRTDVNNGQNPNAQTLHEIQAQARDILDLAKALQKAIEALTPACPSANSIVQRLVGKAVILDQLAQFLREDPSINTCDEMLDLLNQMQMQLTQLQQALDICFPPCVGDANQNGVVDIDDLVIVITHWGQTGTPGTVPGDVNQDGVVNIDDLVQVITHWGNCP